MVSFLNKVNRSIIYLLIFLIPFFYLPLTNNPIEWNKQYLLYLLVLLIFFVWLIQGVIEKKFVLRRTLLDIPLLVVVGIFLLTSIFSDNRLVSFLGDAQNIYGTFLSITFFALAYFLFVQHFSTFQQYRSVVVISIISGLVNGLYFLTKVFGLGILQFIGHDDWNLTSISNTRFGIYLVIVFLLSFSVLLVQSKWGWRETLASLSGLVSIYGLIAISFKTVWIVFAVGLLFLLIFAVRKLSHMRKTSVVVLFGLFVVSLLFIFLNTPTFLRAGLPIEISLGTKLSWGIALKTITSDVRHFLFGSGAGTFLYDFSLYRPQEFNLNNFAWSIRFGDSHDTALSILTEGGMLGALGYLLVLLMGFGAIIAVLFHTGSFLTSDQATSKKTRSLGGISSSDGEPFLEFLPFMLCAIWITIVFSFFISDFGVVLWFLFWLVLALLASIVSRVIHRKKEIEISLKISPQYVLISAFGIILLFAGSVVLGSYLGKFYLADVAHARALRAPSLRDNERLALLTRAIQLNPRRSEYYVSLAQGYLNQAIIESQKENKNAQVIANLVAIAVNQAKTATNLAPENVQTWENLSVMYANAQALAPEANKWVISALEEGIKLEPVNPLFHLALANAKALEGRLTEAKDDYEQAIFLKSDFLEPYLRLAGLYELEGDLDSAIQRLEKAIPFSQNNPLVVFQLGRLYYNRNKEGDNARAEQAFAVAIQMNPGYSNALFSLGLVYENRYNDIQKALLLYRRVLELNPDNSDIKKKIQSLTRQEVVAPETAETEEKSTSDTQKKDE